MLYYLLLYYSKKIVKTFYAFVMSALGLNPESRRGRGGL